MQCLVKIQFEHLDRYGAEKERNHLAFVGKMMGKSLCPEVAVQEDIMQ